MKKTFLRQGNKCHLILSIFIVFLGFTAFSLGRTFYSTEITGASESSDIQDHSSQYLRIDVMIDKKAGTTTIPLDQPSGNHTEIIFKGLSDVTIKLDGVSTKLETAINEKRISIDQIISYARLDASNGFCKEVVKSQNSLTRFVYQYPEFDLLYINDIYETPTGQHLISEFSVYAKGIHTFSSDYRNTYRDKKTGRPIDYEYWGLDFAVTEVNATGITIKCTQSNGQQIGNLVADFLSVAKRDVDDSGNSFDISLEKISSEAIPGFFINMEDSTKISIDLSSMYGELPSDNYVLYFIIKDEYSEDMVHPLMRNYYDQQIYEVLFTIE